MICKNCGAKIKSSYQQCPNCGADISEENGYRLTSYNERYDYYDDEKPVKKNRFKGIVALLLAIALIVGGEYYYFNVYKKPSGQPKLSFSYGAGIINDDEQIVYIALPESSRIEYIAGVSLYDYDKTDPSKSGDAISTDYEYTKAVNGVFRAIFFDLADFGIQAGQDYTYTFEMTFSFYEDSQQYDYEQVVSFSGSASSDVSDIVFDHSMRSDVGTTIAVSENEEESTTTQTTTETTTATANDPAFLYNSYWYTEPYQDDSTYIMDVIKLSSGGACTITTYTKVGDAQWTTASENTTYTINESTITINGNGDYNIDYSNGTVAGLTARNYNSQKNVEDFFGI